MAQITDYATLQTEVARLLNRGDLTDDIPGFIQDLESRLKDDERAWRLTTRSPFAAGADGVNLPSNLVAIDSLYHDGPTYFEPVLIVGPEELPDLKLRTGTTGPPGYAAVFEASPPTLSFAPAPDATYNLKLTFWESIASLSDSVTSNWLLLDRPDIYKFGACVSAAPFLKKDERLQIWEGIYNQRLDELFAATQRRRTGRNTRRNVTPLGG